MADESNPTTPPAPAPAAPAERPAGGERPAHGERPARGPRPGGPRGDRKFFRRKKVCKFCVEKIDAINYKDVRLLGQFVAESGKIVPRRLTGV
ncbi:MAG TPA: 30S ribosomal protein S18, partial [Terriglobales bacterium]|nr:30S ribosomal protein S18 [Terriglobales bacterium]